MAARLTAYVVVAIVAATLIAGLIVGAQRDDSDGPVDLIIQNANIYTADRRGTMAEAVAVRGNQILRVGSNREVARLERPQTMVIDARGGAVLPGFIDARADLIAGGMDLGVADLSDATSADEIFERIAAWAAANPTARWVVGKGWSAAHFKNGLPTRHMLDAIVSDRPALMYAASDRTPAIWVNSKALQLAGVNRRTPDPGDGTIVRDAASREPSGVITGSAAELRSALTAGTKEDQLAGALDAALAEANRLGVTSVQHTGSCDAETYDAARRDGRLTVRVYCSTRLDPAATIHSETDIATFDAFRKRYPDDPVLKAGALTIALDGSLARHQAHLLEPYAESESSGKAGFHSDVLNRTIRLADAGGWQLITEATGDGAVRMALNAYAHAVRSNRAPARGRRHRIQGLGLVDAADMPRFGPLGVTASIQPLFARPPAGDVDLLPRNLGQERASRVFPVMDVAGTTRLILGSGWPARPLDPLLVIDSVVNPAPAEDAADENSATSRGLSLKAAIDAYTSSAAWASFDEQRKGSISAGMLADIVVLADDVFAAPEKLASTSVAVTIFDGKIVYSRTPRVQTEPAPSPQN